MAKNCKQISKKLIDQQQIMKLKKKPISKHVKGTNCTKVATPNIQNIKRVCKRTTRFTPFIHFRFQFKHLLLGLIKKAGNG